MAAHFRTLSLGDVPHSRAGKHKLIVSMILRDLDQLKEGTALRVPLADLENTKANVRSALNRATRNAADKIGPILLAQNTWLVSASQTARIECHEIWCYTELLRASAIS